MIQEFLQREFYHNRISEYLVCLAIIVVGIVVVRVVEVLALRRMKAWAATTPSTLDYFLIDRIHRTGAPLAYIGIAHTSLRVLTLSPRLERVIDMAGVVLLTLIATVFTVALVRYSFEEYMRKRGMDASGDRALKGVVGLTKAMVWVVGTLFLLDNLGFKISTVVAGLGIGGIAVALALQNVLGDLLASLSIALDQPFVLGDFLIVDEHLGAVEYIGIKSTRLRSLTGEQIVMSNADLLSSRLRNYGRMYERRIVFSLGVTYETPREKLERIPALLRKIIEAQEGVRFDRAHFAKYGDFSLDFEIVYYVQSPDYGVYMDAQQAIYFRIHEAFENLGVQFAYPTQTLWMAGGAAAPQPQVASEAA